MIREVIINPRKIAVLLIVASCVLAVLSITGEYLLEKVVDSDSDPVLALGLDLFSVNAEETIPTWYSTIILFVASVLLAAIAIVKRATRDPLALYWIGLAIVFFYLSMDEGAVIHEIVADAIQVALDTTGFLYFGWQIAAAPFVVVFGLVYLRFLFLIPAKTRNLFILAGTIYIGGAVFIEAISANQYYIDGEASLRYLAIGTLEELMEMLGIEIFIYALLSYIVDMGYSFTFRPPALSEPLDPQPSVASEPPESESEGKTASGSALWFLSATWWMGILVGGIVTLLVGFAILPRLTQPAGTVLMSVTDQDNTLTVRETAPGVRLLYVNDEVALSSTQALRRNRLLGMLPAELLRPQKALLLSDGSTTLKPAVAGFANAVEVVVLDPLLAVASSYLFTGSANSQGSVIDDPMHYLVNNPGQFQLVILDFLPDEFVPYAAAYMSSPFYQAVAKRLSVDGVVVTGLRQLFVLDDPASQQGVATLLDAFNEVLVLSVNSGEASYAFAGHSLPFDSTTLSQLLADYGEEHFLIFDPPTVRAVVSLQAA